MQIPEYNYASIYDEKEFNLMQIQIQIQAFIRVTISYTGAINSSLYLELKFTVPLIQLQFPLFFS